MTVRNRNFNLSLEAKPDHAKVREQSLVEQLQFYGETKRADGTTEVVYKMCWMLVLRWTTMVLLSAELDSCNTTKGDTSPD